MLNTLNFRVRIIAAPERVITQDLSIQTFAVESHEPLIRENFPDAMLQTEENKIQIVSIHNACVIEGKDELS